MSSTLTKINVADILCEVFEVIIHNILYTRKLYPDIIFVPKKKYSVIVYQSIHPDINEYINQCLKAATFHTKNNRLKRLFVCFHNEIIYEKYVLEVLELLSSVESDPFLVDLEQSVRDFILKLHSSENYLEELPANATFSIRIETTAYSSLEFNQKPEFEDFPWIEVKEEENSVTSADIVPVHTVKTSFLTLQVTCDSEKTDMENGETGLKRKSRLAVFEHVSETRKSRKKRKFRTNRIDSEDSSPSESELVIDDEKEEPMKKKKNALIRLSQEPLFMHCEWNFCDETFCSWKDFNEHLMEHAATTMETKDCRWLNCGLNCESGNIYLQHMSYHGYMSKLKNIGQNILDRNNWPTCNLEENYKIVVVPGGYNCRWENCSWNFCTIYDFLTHMEVHIHNNPRVSNKMTNDIIECAWGECHTKFSSKYKLAEHIRTHTKEKIIACPTCCTTFANKTKLCDHRKRQLATDLQSYQCSQCLKLFPSERLLREHMRSHINHYKCTMCDMTCPKPSILAKHMRFKHIKDKPFQCPTCDKRFVAKHNLDTHLKIHSEENPMKCDLCDFECRAKNGLDNHYESEHNKHCAVYQCHCCKKNFRRGSYLTKHLMKVHNYHWPSGHSRFRYRKDQDGIHRLQTVRYESLEVTQEMIKSESLQSSNREDSVNYSLKYDNDGKPIYVLSVSENGEQSLKMSKEEEENILITITDVDDQGNVVKSVDIQSHLLEKIAGLTENAEGSGAGRQAKRGRKRKWKQGKVKLETTSEIDVMDEPIRYFSEDVLNEQKFEIKTE